MKQVETKLINEVTEFIQASIGEFNSRRVASLKSFKLTNVLKKKNPYLFKAKNINNAHDFVKLFLDAHLSSQEEVTLSEFLRRLAIFVCGRVYGGVKSSIEGIDLEFKKNNIVYIVSLRSNPDWENSNQVKRMIENFKKAKKILRADNSNINVQAINGCFYGKTANPDKGDYQKLCGQDFWQFISGSEYLFVDIIEPLGHQANALDVEYARTVNLSTLEFINTFCVDGVIKWERLVKFNSGSQSDRKTIINLKL